MSQLDISKLTINVEEARQLSEVIYEAVLEISDLATYHDIHSGIQWDTQIPFLGTLGLVGKQIIKCKPDANGNKIPMSEKKWSPKIVGDRFEHCSTDAEPLFKIFKKLKKVNPDFWDRTNSDELGVVVMRISEAMKEMLQRIVWFGDSEAKTITGGGSFKNGTDLGFFNMIDGLWKQIITKDIPVSSKNYVKIEQNTKNSYSEQNTLDSDFAFNLFRSMWRSADARLKQLISKGGIKLYLHTTSRIAENWQDYREDKSLAFTLDRVEKGGTNDVFRNIVIVPRYDWDSIIESHQNNGKKLNLPHRALLTTPGNIPVGTVSTNDLDNVESFYDPVGKVNIMDFSMKLDTKFLESYLAVAAY